MAQVNADGVTTEFLKRAGEANLVGRDRDAFEFEGVNDFVGADGTVKLTFFVGVRFDADRLFGDEIGEFAEPGEALFLDFEQHRLVFFNHTAVVIGREGGETLRNQVVVRVTAFDFDDVALFAEGVDRLDQKELDTAVRALRQTFAGAVSAASAFVTLLLHD